MPAVRLDITPYSDMHCGHVWCAWHAALWARARGCDFMLRFDDEAFERCETWRQSWSLSHCTARFLEDFEWLGLPPDRVDYTSTYVEEAREAARFLGIRAPAPNVLRAGNGYDVSAAWGGPGEPATMWHPWCALVQVVADHGGRVLQLVRGSDLRWQQQLYTHFWHQLYAGWPPTQTYLRLVWRESSGLKESKSNVPAAANISVRDLREAGYAPEEIISTLRACEARGGIAMSPRWVEHLWIPKGYLEPDTHGVLEFVEPVTGEVVNQAPFPWGEDVKAAIARRIITGGQEPPDNAR